MIVHMLVGIAAVWALVLAVIGLVVLMDKHPTIAAALILTAFGAALGLVF